MPRCHECSAVFSRRVPSASRLRRSTPFSRSASMKNARAAFDVVWSGTMLATVAGLPKLPTGSYSRRRGDRWQAEHSHGRDRRLGDHGFRAGRSRCPRRLRRDRARRARRASADCVLRTIDTGLAKAVERGKATEDERDQVIGPDHRHRGHRGVGRVRSGDRVGDRGDRRQVGVVRRTRHEPPSPRRSWPPTPRPCPSSTWRWPPRGPNKCAASTSSTRHRDEARRGRASAHRIRRDDRVRQWPSSLRAARTRSKCRTTPASSSTRCCSRTSTTRCACSNGARRSIEAIDTAMKGGCNFPMGPFALLDLVGLDTSVAILETVHAAFGDPGYAPAQTLRRHGRRRPPRSQDQARLLHVLTSRLMSGTRLRPN